MFKNITAYEITFFDDVNIERNVFQNCPPFQPKSVGWYPVFDNRYSYSASITATALKVKFQTRLVPPSQLTSATNAKVKKLYPDKRPSNKVIGELRESVYIDLLPNAPLVDKFVDVIVTPRHVLIDTSSAKFADEILSMLKQGSGLRTKLLPPAELDMTIAMTHWLATKTEIPHMVIGGHCVIEGTDGQTINIRQSCELAIDAADAIGSGGRVIKLELDHNNGLTFIINEACTISTIRGFDKNKYDTQAEAVAADTVMMAEYAGEIIDALTTAFGE